MGEVAISPPLKLPSAPAAEAVAFISMIERAARDPSVDLDKMERLMQMHQAAMARSARASYFAAMAEMQEHLPAIEERGVIDIGRGKPQSYALWEDINEAIKPVLSGYGFALSFRTGRTDAHIVVTGILSHREGHSEETTMHLPLDSSGSKNSVQAVGSSTSYGKRYAASALLNLTSRAKEDRDDDGADTGRGETITKAQADEIRALMDETGADVRKFCEHFKIASVPDLKAADYGRAMTLLSRKRGSA